MEFAVGAVLPGKITGITKFGAFVSLPENKTGMVHISEVANTYVNDIKDHLSEGQEVNVKIIGIDKDGRVNLSIKKTLEPPAPRQERSYPAGPRRQAAPSSLTFEDKLKQFMTDSESKISDLRQHGDRKGTRRGRR